MANSVEPDQTAPIGAVCSGSTLFASMLNLSVMLGNYLQQTTSADNIFRCIFFLGAFRVKSIVNGRWTDGRPTKTDHKSSPCHYVYALYMNRNARKPVFVVSNSDIQTSLLSYRD